MAKLSAGSAAAERRQQRQQRQHNNFMSRQIEKMPHNSALEKYAHTQLKKIENSSSRFWQWRRSAFAAAATETAQPEFPLFYQTANGSAIRDGHTVVSLSRQNGHSWRERQYAGRAGWLIEIETAHIKIKWLLLGLMNFPLARTLSHSNMATIYPLSLALSPTLAHAYAPAPAHGYVPLARTLDNDDDAAFLGFLAGRIDCCAQFKLNFHCERVCRSFTLALSLFRSPTGPLALCREKS